MTTAIRIAKGRALELTKLPSTGRLMLVVCLSLPFPLAAEVVVRSHSEHFDAFKARDERARQQRLQETLRATEQLGMLQSLPFGCLFLPQSAPLYFCQGVWYRPCASQGVECYIEVPTPQMDGAKPAPPLK